MQRRAHAMLLGVLGLAVVLAPVGLATAHNGGPLAGIAEGSSEETPQGERWQGTVDQSSAGGPPLEFFVTFVPKDEGEGFDATMDIPSQGASGLALSEVVYTAEEVSFLLPIAQPPPGARWVGARSDDGDAVEGTFTQGPYEFPFTMSRVEEGGTAAGALRPQHPQPPFPYLARDVTYTNPVDGTTLAGTLTLPEGAGPHPAALLITGSGGQDRDETIFGHKPFLVIADHLTRNGVAVLRVDDRGIGGSTGARPGLTSEDFAGDVLAGIEFLQQQPEIEAGQIGLIGHSEGGIIAPMVAARSPDVAFIVLLAGTGLPGSEIMPWQLEQVQLAIGRPEDNVRRQVEAQRALLDRIIERAGEEAIREAVAALVDIQLSTLPEDHPARAPQAVEQLLASQAAQVMSPWYHFFLTYDPRVSLRQVTCPVLALNGSLDLQVPAELSLPEIERALAASGNPDVTVVELEGLNHLFQTATSGSVGEYGRIQETFSPAALDLITEWIQERTRAAS